MRSSRWVLALVLTALAIVGCTSNPPPAEFEENVGQTSQALFANGQACSAGAQCATNNCVDAVCCDTPCGAGARDNFSCSNIYGAVPGLVPGTCTTLTNSQFCGILTISGGRCTW